MRFDFLGLRSAWLDIANYREWIRTIKREKNNPQSLFNKYDLSHNMTYMLYLVLTLPEEDKLIPDNIKRLRVIDSLRPVNRYLDEELRFAEYLVPEFNQVMDEDGEPTLSYVIAYRFAFKTIGLGWILKRLLLLGVLTFVGFKIPWQQLTEWISTLI